jgi:hypothetical protein
MREREREKRKEDGASTPLLASSIWTEIWGNPITTGKRAWPRLLLWIFPCHVRRCTTVDVPEGGEAPGRVRTGPPVAAVSRHAPDVSWRKGETPRDGESTFLVGGRRSYGDFRGCGGQWMQGQPEEASRRDPVPSIPDWYCQRVGAPDTWGSRAAAALLVRRWPAPLGG